ERALVPTGMRQRQRGRLGPKTVDRDHIDVERSRRPPLAPRPTTGVLHTVRDFEQLLGVARGNFYDDVEKRRRPAHTNRLGLIDRRHSQDGIVHPQQLDGGVEMCRPVTEIGAERENRSHNRGLRIVTEMSSTGTTTGASGLCTSTVTACTR